MSISVAARRAVAMIAALAILLLGLAIASQATGTAARAAGEVVFDNIPATLPGNIAGLEFQSQGANEFGAAVRLAGTDRVLDDITVVFASWACNTGTWQQGCSTTPGTTYTHPVTVNVYAEDASVPEVTTLLATKTETITAPYRPSVDAELCESATQWFSAPDNRCWDGLAFTHTFSLSSLGVTLPDRFVIAVSFNTGSYGTTPTGNLTAPYNWLNVAMPQLPLYDGPTVGTLPEPDAVYLWNAETGALVNVDWTEEFERNPGFRVSAHAALAATGSETDLAAAGIGGALMLFGAMALVLVARGRHAAAE